MGFTREVFAGASAPAFLPAQALDLGREKGRESGGKENKNGHDAAALGNAAQGAGLF